MGRLVNDVGDALPKSPHPLVTAFYVRFNRNLISRLEMPLTETYLLILLIEQMDGIDSSLDVLRHITVSAPSGNSFPLSPPDLPLRLWSTSNSPAKDTARRSCFCRLLIQVEYPTWNGQEVSQDNLKPVIEHVDAEFLRLFRFLSLIALDESPSVAARASTTLLHGQQLSILFGPATDLTRVQALLTTCMAVSSRGGESFAFLNLYTATLQVLSCRVTARILRTPTSQIGASSAPTTRHCLLLITPVSFWAYCKHPELFATLHPLSPTAPERRPEDFDYDSSGRRKRRRRCHSSAQSQNQGPSKSKTRAKCPVQRTSPTGRRQGKKINTT